MIIKQVYVYNVSEEQAIDAIPEDLYEYEVGEEYFEELQDSLCDADFETEWIYPDDSKRELIEIWDRKRAELGEGSIEDMKENIKYCQEQIEKYTKMMNKLKKAVNSAR